LIAKETPFCEDYTQKTDGSYPFRSEMMIYVQPDSPLFFTSADDKQKFASLIFHNANTSGLLVSHPIIYHTTGKPGNGFVMMGKYFQKPLLDELSVVFKHPIELLSRDEKHELGFPSPQSLQNRKIFVRIRNETTISGYLVIPDPVTGEETIFRVNAPRSLYLEGVGTLTSYLLLILCIICIFSILAIVALSFYYRYAMMSAEVAREKEYSYQKIIEEMEDAYFTASLDGIIQKVGPGTVKMLGYTNESEIVGKSLADFYQNPDDRNMLRTVLFTDQQLKNRPLVVKRKDDSLLFITVNVHLMYDDKGNVVGIEGVAHDNTALILGPKGSEDDSFYRLIFESANIGLFQSNADGHLSFVNPAFASMFGYSGPEQMRSEMTDVLHEFGFLPHDKKQLIEYLNIHGFIYDLEVSFTKSDGSHIWLSCNIVAIKDSQEKLVAFFGTALDITEKKHMEMLLKESEQKYREMFTNVSLGLILFEYPKNGGKGRIIDLNPRAEEMIHCSAEELREKECYINDFLPMCDPSLFQDHHLQNSTVCTFESGIMRGYGDSRPVQVTLDTFYLGQKMVGLAIVEDITEKRRYEEEKIRLIAQIEKNLAELAILNDGIRNPLTIIMMLMENLDKDIADQVIRQIRAIDVLINQLDKRWLESDKILKYLQKHSHIGNT
jgi:PAS domain S-box-containing protein